MKNRSYLVGSVLTLLAFSQSTFAMASFNNDYLLAEIKFKTCQSKQELNFYQLTPVEAYKNYIRCKSEIKPLAEAGYKSVLKILKKSTGRAALKEFHAAFMARVESSEAKDGELKSHYTSRIAALDEKVESAQQKLLLELPN